MLRKDEGKATPLRLAVLLVRRNNSDVCNVLARSVVLSVPKVSMPLVTPRMAIPRAMDGRELEVLIV